MKTKYVLLVLVLIGTSVNAVVGQSRIAPSSTATVYVYRSNTWLSVARKYWVYANGKPSCKIRNNRHCQLTLPTGPVTFTTKLAGLTLVPKKRSQLALTLEPGKTYYLQADLKTKLMPLQAVLPLTEVVPNVDKLEEIKQSKTEQALVSATE